MTGAQLANCTKRKLLERYHVILIALLPLFYLIANPSFGKNQAGDVDIWFYYGLAKSFWHHLSHEFNNDYYETRLPYIIPAALVFLIPNDRTAELVFSYIMYCVPAFSLFYILSRWSSRSAALLTTIIMASDIYFMRTVGWQYVDNGILAYGSLTFAALTAANDSRHRYALVALSGFLFASMLMVHIGSAPLGLPLFAYALFVFDVRRLTWLNFSKLLSCALLGAISCQAMYGLLNMFWYHTGFFFEVQQFIAGLDSEKDPGYFDRLSSIFTYGWWLTLHVGVWLAAGLMIVATLSRVFTPSRFQTYCMCAVFSTYSILFVFDYFHLTIYSGRTGLYASFFFLLSYLFIGSIVPSTIGTRAVLIGGGLFVLSLLLRSKFGEWSAFGLGRTLHATSALSVGLALGVMLAIIAVLRNSVVRLVAMAAAGMLALPITCQFFYEDDIYLARHAIVAATGDRLPYFAFSEHDPSYTSVTTGLVGSFTPRAWRIACNNFPDCLARSTGHRNMIVITSDFNPARVRSALITAIPEAMPGAPKLIFQSASKFSVYRFSIQPWPDVIPASQLYSQVGTLEGSARVAREGTSPGTLTYGPYASVPPGKYQVVIEYQAQGASGIWDVVSVPDSKSFARGNITDSRGATADITTVIDLPHGANGLEVRTFYSGHGRLTVFSIRLRPSAAKKS